MKICFIAPHSDDVELSCAGTLFKHKAQGDEIYYIVVSDCSDLPRNKDLATEVKKVMKCINPDHELRLDLKNRKLDTPLNRERIREALEQLRDDIGMDLIYCPWLGDIHQDHRAVAEECIRTFRDESILMYENVHSTPHFNPNYYVILSHLQAKKKISVIKLFKSQSHLFYTKPRVILNRLEARGIEVKKDYAEAFIVWRLKA